MNINFFPQKKMKVLNLRRNGTPPLFDVLPSEINNENYFLFIGFICTKFHNFPRSWLKVRLVICGSRVRVMHRFYFLSLLWNFTNAFLGQML